jgi:hypothetical protein
VPFVVKICFSVKTGDISAGFYINQSALNGFEVRQELGADWRIIEL